MFGIKFVSQNVQPSYKPPLSMLANGHLLLIAAFCGTILASSGDRALEFQQCISSCSTNNCHTTHTKFPLPLALQLTGWTCEDDCKYSCMHEITNRDIRQGTPVHQYYGKWPFWRFAGMQEPASVAFSLLNLWAHVQGVLKVQRQIPKTHHMRRYYLAWSFASINAWIWSSVFHTRGKFSSGLDDKLISSQAHTDLPITEKLDYFSAALAILYALYYTVVRLFHLDPRQYRPTSQSTRMPYRTWSLLCIIAYVVHVSYLSLLPRFDYTYNMAFNLLIGLVHNVLWFVYALPISVLQRFPSQSKSYRPDYAYKAGVFVALTTAATALELFDFPAWGRVIDAHALWHLSTVSIAMFWYDFLVEDSRDGGWRQQKA